jgi:hypothetical protein
LLGWHALFGQASTQIQIARRRVCSGKTSHHSGKHMNSNHQKQGACGQDYRHLAECPTNKAIQITVHQGIKMADTIETASSLHTGALLASDAHTATPPQRMEWNVTLESSGDASFCTQPDHHMDIGDNAESWDLPVAQTRKTPTPEGISNGISSDSDSSALSVMLLLIRRFNTNSHDHKVLCG